MAKFEQSSGPGQQPSFHNLPFILGNNSNISIFSTTSCWVIFIFVSQKSLHVSVIQSMRHRDTPASQEIIAELLRHSIQYNGDANFIVLKATPTYASTNAMLENRVGRFLKEEFSCNMLTGMLHHKFATDTLGERCQRCGLQVCMELLGIRRSTKRRSRWSFFRTRLS